jgi:hypothetical protein
MDEEILEALYENPFQHQEEMVVSLLDENETEQDFNDDIHVPSPENDEDLHQPCQSSCDQEYEENYLYVSSDCSFSEFLFQEGNCENHIYEIACINTLDSEPIHDYYTPQLQENSEEGHTVLDTFETEETTQNFLSLENTNPRFLDSQNEIHVDLHEELNIQVVVVPIDKCPEYMNFLLDMDDKENNQSVAICFEKDLEFENIEQDQPTVEVRKTSKR